MGKSKPTATQRGLVKQPRPGKPAATGKPASKTAVLAKVATPGATKPTPAKSGRAAHPDRTAPRRPAGTPAAASPIARRPRTAASAKRTQLPAKPKPPQSFTVSHLMESDFKADGLRSYAQYRDLGIAAASAGLCQAHVIRFTPPCTDAVRKRHRHAADLQLIYVLKGWMKNEFAGIGEQMMSTGSCWLQPAGIDHTVLDYSADCEVLEIVVPADFTTEDRV